MIEINISPVLYQWGGVKLGWHGILLTLGFISAYVVVVQRGRQLGLLSVNYSELMFQASLWGYVGARLLHILDNLSFYRLNPSLILLAYRGGLSLFGGLIAGVATILFYTKKRKISFWQLMDAIGFGIPTGEFVGRAGCFINGDVYGFPTGSNWGVIYIHPLASLPVDYKGIPLFPAALAIQVWCGLMLLGLLWIGNKYHTPGKLFWTSGMIYCLGRFAIGAWQPGSQLYAELTSNQAIALLMMIILGAAGFMIFAAPRKIN
jgi:phosphatidylglycerol:prolipoprotein diacylglycerol transferase